MTDPNLNSQVIRQEVYGTAPVSTRLARQERSQTMSFYTKYLRYALSTLANVAFGLAAN